MNKKVNKTGYLKGIPTYYIYRHRRLDTNEVFYVGIGQNHKNKKYKRAFEKHGRNNYWNNVVNKTGYSVEILLEGTNKEDIFEIEEFLITIYGRKCYNEGCLTNIATGGEGAFGVKQSEEIKKWRSDRWKGEANPALNKKGEDNHRFGIPRSKKTKKAISEALKGIPLTKEHRDKLSKTKIGKYRRGNNPAAKRVINTKTGYVYDSLVEAADSTSFKYGTLKAMLQGRNKNKTNLEYYENTK